MNKEKKLEKILHSAATEDLEDYRSMVKVLKKKTKLPVVGGTSRIAAALLKELVGDVSNLSLERIFNKSEDGTIVFEDIKDGRARLFINIGKNHHISTGDLIREIVKRSGIDGKSIGKIDIHTTYSFFEIPEQFAEMVLHSFDSARIKGLNVVVEPAKRRKK